MLDTHFLVWLTDEPSRLTRQEIAVLNTSVIAVSVISIWEIRLKWQSLGRDGLPKLDLHPDAALRTAENLNLNVIALNERHAAARLVVPIAHKDPFDEMLLIQAQEEGLQLMTRDRLLVGHPLALAR